MAYLASGPGGGLVVKWYNAEQATDAQRQAIRQLVKDGPPTGLAGKWFVWPLEVVTAPQSRQFGSWPGTTQGRHVDTLLEFAGNRSNAMLPNKLSRLKTKNGCKRRNQSGFLS